MGQSKKENVITQSDFRRETLKGLKKYDRLSFFEHYAMYMGVSQLVEISLKNLLDQKFGIDTEKSEKWSLGTVSKKLKELGLRADFFLLLDPVIIDRNYITHDMLASDYFMNGLFRSGRQKIFTKDRRHLYRATYELEQLVFLISWCNDNNGWD